MPDGVAPKVAAADAAADAARIFVVVPARDEARLLPRTLRSIPAWVERVVVVDDGSRDGTIEAARGVCDARLEVVVHPINRGVGAAIVSGYRKAFELGADVAVVMGADAQMDPADLERLLAPVIEGRAGYAKGDRLSHPDCLRAMPKDRLLGNVGLTLLTRWATGLRIRDSQCGYTALHRDAASKLELEALWPRYGYPNDVLARCARAGVKVADVIVRPIYGDETSGVRWLDALVRVPMVIALGALRR